MRLSLQHHASPAQQQQPSAQHHCQHRQQRSRVATRATAQPPPQPDDSREVTIAQSLTAIGLNGTLAVAGASLCGISLISQLHWERTADIALALQFQSVLLALEAALFLPAWGIPQSLLEPQQQQQEQEQQQQQQQPRYLDVAAVGRLGAWSPQAWQLMLSMLRSVIRRPQLQQLPLPASLGLMVGREATKEILQRGFVLAGLAGWLTDRLYEADVGGADGSLLLAGVPVTLQEAGLLAASVLATTLFAPAAYIAAEEAAAGVSGALLLNTEAGRAVKAMAAAAKAGGSQQQQQQQLLQRLAPPRPPSSSSSDSEQHGAPPSSSGGAGADDDAERLDEPLDPRVLEYRIIRVTEAVYGSAPAQLAYRITLAKELGRLMLANLVFVVTQQNLAATLSAGLVANALLLAYGRVLGGSDGDTPLGGKPAARD